MKVVLALRIVTITLIAGWCASALVGAGFALLQYQEIVRSFPPDRVAAEFQTRLDRELWRGSLLLFAHGGLIAGILWWQVQNARRTAASRHVGLLAGVGLACVEGIIGWRLGTPLLFLIPLCVLVVAAGWAADQAASLSPSSEGDL